MSIDRNELERLLADRPAAQRSAMQAVRDSYDDITLMREKGLSWSEISAFLARLGVTVKDNQPIAPVTLRSAYFLVSNEGRDDLPPADPKLRASLEKLLADDSAAPDAAPAVEERPPPAPPESVPATTGGTIAADEDSAVEPAADETSDETASLCGEPAAEEPDGEEPDGEEPDGEEPDGEDMENAVPADGAPAGEERIGGAVEEDAAVDVAEADVAEADVAEADVAEADVAESEIDGGGDEAGQADDEPTSVASVSQTPPAAGRAVEPFSPFALRSPSPPASTPASTPLIFQSPVAAAPVFAAAAPVAVSPVTDANTNAKDNRMLGTIFVLNDRGGVGKTLLSHHLIATAMLDGLQLRVVEYEVNERLARLFGPDVVEHRRISQDFMNLMGSGDGFYEFWDQIGPELQRGGRLFDFGGNISQWFFNWAEVSGFDYYVGEGERLTFMVPVTVDLASLSTGMATLDRIAAIAPKARRVLVENGVSGPFSQLEDSQYGRRKAELVEREGVEVISMPPCTAPAWARLTGHRIDQIAQMTREDLAKLGMTPPVASRSLIIIHEWLRNLRNSLSPYVLEALRPSPTPPGRPTR